MPSDWHLASIEPEARANGRLRFLRVALASVVGIGPLVVAIMLVADGIDDLFINRTPNLLEALAAVFAIGVAVTLFTLPFVIVVFVAWLVAQLVDRLPPRLVALAMALVTVPALAFIIVAMLSAPFVEGIEVGERITVLLGPLGFLLVLFTMFAYYRCQLFAPSTHIDAVRGWRVPLGRLGASVWRTLGLPAFLAALNRRVLGVVPLYLGVAFLNASVFIVPLAPVMLTAESEPANAPDPVLSLTLMVVLAGNAIGLGRLVERFAETRLTRRYQQVRSWDDRAPVVFLRAFLQDAVKIRGRADLVALLPAGVSRRRTLDEVLLEHASPYGPVIAVGDPADPRPPLGAARIFVTDEAGSWQDVVRELVLAARAVVIAPNDSPGVRWELDLLANEATCPVVVLANPLLTPEQNRLGLASALGLEPPELPRQAVPIAGFRDRDRQATLLHARRLGHDAVAVALNLALQGHFGVEGVAAGPRPHAPVDGSAP